MGLDNGPRNTDSGESAQRREAGYKIQKKKGVQHGKNNPQKIWQKNDRTSQDRTSHINESKAIRSRKESSSYQSR
tara:strand:+ start:302 stop:526 length:225 start_codon:yes stop_codon:yes gene_type:complete